MNKRRVARYIRECADRLGLRDWIIEYDPEPVEEEGTLAVVDTEQGCVARIRLCVEFQDFNARQQRGIIAHELCHLKTLPLRGAADALVQDEPRRARKKIRALIEEADEHVVESLAQIAIHLLPLPHFPSTKSRTP